MSDLDRIKQAMADGEHTDGDLEWAINEIERLRKEVAYNRKDMHALRDECRRLEGHNAKLQANAVTMEEYINDIAKPKIERLLDLSSVKAAQGLIDLVATKDREIERLRERCRIQDKLISDNADLHDTIERLEADAENLRNTITSTHLSLKERDVEIEALRAALKGVDAYPNTLRDLEDDK